MPLLKKGIGGEGVNRPQGKGQFIPKMTLREDQDRVRFRVVSSMDQWGVQEGQFDSHAQKMGLPDTLVWGEFHRELMTSKTGKQWAKFHPCSMEQDADTNEAVGDCGFCKNEVRRTSQFMMWVYVYAYYHLKPSTDSSKPWELVKFGNINLYKEVVDDYQLWQDGFYMMQKILGKCTQYGTMSDRDYLITRLGKRGDQKVTRELEPIKPSAINSDTVLGAAHLPSLLDVAMGKVETMDGLTQSTDVSGVMPEVSMNEPTSVEFGADDLDGSLDMDLFGEVEVAGPIGATPSLPYDQNNESVMSAGSSSAGQMAPASVPPAEVPNELDEMLSDVPF